MPVLGMSTSIYTAGVRTTVWRGMSGDDVLTRALALGTLASTPPR